jgi:hypothetical protein
MICTKKKIEVDITHTCDLYEMQITGYGGFVKCIRMGEICLDCFWSSWMTLEEYAARCIEVDGSRKK